jgi:hypothetical protein
MRRHRAGLPLGVLEELGRLIPGEGAPEEGAILAVFAR